MSYNKFGKIIAHKIIDNTVHIDFENHSSRIEIITPWIINVFSQHKYNDHFSRAVEGDKSLPCHIDVSMEGDHLEISTERLSLKVFDDFYVDFYSSTGNLICKDYRHDRSPFVRRGAVSIAEEEGHKVESSFQEHKIEIKKEFLSSECFYGLGDKTGHMNKRGCSYEMWNTDDPSPHVESHKSLYKSIPFFTAHCEDFSYGIFFDNTFKTYFDMGKENSEYFYFGSDDGNLDYYFIYGEDIKDIIGNYTYLTGKTPLPQKWTLGYQQSRWAYTPESRVRELASNFRKHKIPCDVIHLDIDYMDNYKVFTWDKEKFPDEKSFINDMNSDGFKIVTIIDPGVKKEKGYNVYDEGIKNGYFATDKDNIPYVNKVWPGDSLFPDYSNSETRKWWADNQKIMLDSGVSGIWNDMNEPASFNGPLPDDVQFSNEGRGGDHTEIHNIYGHLMSKATYEGLKTHSGKRPFVITRAAYAGTQKYSTVWTGDNQSFWEHLRMSVPMLLNLGMSGISFAGTDVGGFSFDCTGELLSRWIQVGCFSPLLRNHSCVHTRDQEPWAFDKETLDINRKYINLRYSLIPLFYDLMWKGEIDGLPLMRPLVMNFPGDKNTFNLNDQFMLGESFLVAPVMEQGKTFRALYLPDGKWFDYWTKKPVDGGSTILRDAPLDTCPIYVKEGSIIPKYPHMNYIGETKVEELELEIYPGDGEHTHYIDDGESFKYREGEFTSFKMSQSNVDSHCDVSIELLKNNFPYYKQLKIVYFKDLKEVLVNGKPIQFQVNDNTTSFVIPVETQHIALK